MATISSFGIDSFDNADSSFQGLGNLIATGPLGIILGCTTPGSFNYNPNATQDDGSCVAVVYGCIDPTAVNYNSAANTDNGTCLYNGCTDPLYLEYDVNQMPPANNNPGNVYCLTLITYGCTIVTAINIGDNNTSNLLYPLYWNGSTVAGQMPCDGNQPGASDDCVGGIPNGTANCCCETAIVGCTDATAVNYDSSANFQPHPGSDLACVTTIYGCIDPIADNYDAAANVDDGSCAYTAYGCTDPTASNYMGAPPSNVTQVEDGSCVYPGCMDPAADLYNASATDDDGSCTYTGCTDLTASNYSVFLHPVDGLNYYATTDDGSCCVDGCTDPTACNYDAFATCDDGSCFGIAGCMDSTACSYNPLATCDPNNDCSGVVGCTNSAYLEYDASATCDPNNDQCIILGVPGCMDDGTDPGYTGRPASWVGPANNYDATANFDDGSCCYGADPESCTFIDAAGVVGNTISIGDTYQGGIIFHLEQVTNLDVGTLCGALIVDPVVPLGSAKWQNNSSCGEFFPTGVNSAGQLIAAIGSGYQNSRDIVDNAPAGCTPNAAYITDNNTSAGFSDWYLPSIGELINIEAMLGQNNLFCFTDPAEMIDNPFISNTYWSSTETDIGGAWNVNFSTSTHDISDKDELKTVKGIRREGVAGCTDPLYTEYDSSAVWDDGSCVVTILASLSIGDYYQGGIIFYFNNGTDATNGGYIISQDELVQTAWGQHGINSGTSGNTAIGTGQINTDLIIATLGADALAASYANDYTNDGYTDWFLPSTLELASAMLIEVVVSNANINLSANYWASTEYPTTPILGAMVCIPDANYAAISIEPEIKDRDVGFAISNTNPINAKAVREF